ncbi:hypothetical protein [Catellatospora vulcania]|uniref:hypothetical protein n=1 Tax=Catellatospora vulcania TaxID=1460450 RepID=UPI0012D447ED|nr:hypothetical protein [Catellatospora vulcania]
MHVLDAPSGLSERARAFLAANATREPVGHGPDDETCRAMMREFLGGVDEEALAALRAVQDRWSGLAYVSPTFRMPVQFEPIFDIDEPDIPIQFPYAVLPSPPDGVFGGELRPDGTLLFGMFETDEPAFPSLEAFIEAEALLDWARSRPSAGPPLNDAQLAELLVARPGLRQIEQACGYHMTWWVDDEILVQHRIPAGYLPLDGPQAWRWLV